MEPVRYPFVDLDLARWLERAEASANAGFVEARARLFPDSGATWIDVAGAYAKFDGVGSPLTQSFGLGLFQRVTPAELNTLENFFQERVATECGATGIPDRVYAHQVTTQSVKWT